MVCHGQGLNYIRSGERAEMVSHSVKIKEHKLRWKRIHGSLYECSQVTLHLKLRGFGHDSTLKEIAQSLTVFFCYRMYKEKILFLSASVKESPTQKIQKICYLLSIHKRKSD